VQIEQGSAECGQVVDVRSVADRRWYRGRVYVRAGWIVAVGAVICLAWGAVAVMHFRLTWPYPRVLPATVS
jgi:uncharacterized membrane protein YdfJ with MMPL/SSD domain